VSASIRLIGLDPGLRRTGWGVVDMAGSMLRYVADGQVASDETATLAERLVQLFEGLTTVLARWSPDAAAIEETFVNRNPVSTLKLGMARGVVMLAPAQRGIPVVEYAPNQIKKSVVGVGHAEKAQVAIMVRHLLPGAAPTSADAADALAVAICHGHRLATERSVMAARGMMLPC
jgi:crossover junction endodeoxyribonuclease RuvC